MMALNPEDIASTDWSDFARRVRAYVTRALRDKGTAQDVEDITQETLVHLLRADTARWERGRQSLIVFAFGIAFGLIHNHGRRQARRKKHAAGCQARWRPTSYIGRQERNLERQRLRAWLRAELADDEAAQQVLDELVEGRARFSDSRHLGMSHREYRNARRRLYAGIERRGKAVRRELRFGTKKTRHRK